MRYYRWAALAALTTAIVLGGVTYAAPGPAPLAVALPPATTSENSLVKITLVDGLGSGVHIGNGNIVTAAHVVGDAKTAKVKTIDGAESDATILWVNKDFDIALIHTDGQMAGSSKLDCREPQLGETLQAAGNPLGLEFISAFGRVAGKARSSGPWKSVVVTDMTTVQGQSGGPVFADDGRIVGINVGVAVAPLKSGKSPTGEQLYSPSMTGFGFIVPALAVCNLLARGAV